MSEEPKTGATPKSGTPVLQTGIKMLATIDALARAGQPISVSAVAETMEWSRATAHQYLQTAVAAGWAFQDQNSAYSLSFHAAEVGSKVNPAEEIRPVLLPTMQDAVDKLGAPVSFAVLEQTSPIIVERVEPMRAMFIRRGFEARVSPKSSASGRILVAYSTPEARRAISRVEEVLAEPDYQEIRELGYSIVHSQWLGDLITAVAAPIFHRRVCIGALSVIAERGAHPDEVLIRSMLDASAAINRELEVG
ncbi:Transcriptional regulator, IclR family [Leucobacter sp. 7(1)]|uniref:IclR family transcriptional regulator n=1 Tax=Leucobacter sp. 7(1) TaxID=1255613 RepID=UPI00097EFF4F|nr:helix-turn-helix domain-containing protein [Leucobacter sp. 7(1)]SJN11601.1 Transcriptional regulator, IclR family [Leucobacter sp. 7(1)]